MYDLRVDRTQELAVHATLLGQQVVNVLHFRANSGAADWPDAPAVPTSQDLMTHFRTQILVQFAAQQSDALIYNKLTCKQIDGWNGNFAAPAIHYSHVDEQTLVPATGVMIGDTLPSYVAATIRKNTAFPGRRWRGSMRLAGLLENQTVATDGNRLMAVPHAAIQAAAVAMRTSFRPVLAQANNFMQLCIFSFRQMREDTAAGPFFPLATRTWAAVVETVNTNVYLGSQVSRKVGHGA